MSEGIDEPQDVYCKQKEAKQFKLSLGGFLSFFFFGLLKDKSLFSAKCLDALPE